MHGALIVILTGVVAAGWAYWAAAWQCTRAFFRRPCGPEIAGPKPTVSILKPVKGVDAQAYENFASFCRQDYDDYEILFALADPSDPAAALIRRLQAEFPQRAIRLLVAGQLGANPKCANLHRLAREARGELLVISDSDIRVTSDYLAHVAAPFSDPSVGWVTCPYLGLSPRGAVARLESLHMGAIFLPAVVLAWRLGQRVGMGATMAVRRTDLFRAGGFAAIADHLMDDYQLAGLMESLGLRGVLSKRTVASVLGRERLPALWQREVRWARGIRASRLAGYWGMLLTFPTAWAAALTVAAGFSRWTLILLAATLLMRWAVAWDLEGVLNRRGEGSLPLIPARDLLSFLVWCQGAAGRSVKWRGQRFHLRRDGTLQPINGASPAEGVFARLVRRLDAHLRRRQGIFEFDDDPNCLLRLSFGVCDEAVRLSDGAELRQGDRVCDLHLFNEHIPPLGSGGPDLAWANVTTRRLSRSLSALAGAFLTQARFEGVKALRGETRFIAHGQTRHLARLANQLHFDVISPRPAPGPLQRLHRIGEDMLLWALLRTFNPGGLRGANFMRNRHRLYMSRSTLIDRYGHKEDAELSHAPGERVSTRGGP